MRAGPIAALLAAALAASTSARADVAVAVDASADRRPISPLVYGMAFPTDAQIDAGGVTVARWGGNSTSRYNFEIDVHNTGADWYFENLPGCFTAEAGWCKRRPADPKEESSANAFLSHARQKSLITLFTVPMIGWVPKGPPRYGHPFACGCPRATSAAQASFDRWDPGCGDGKAPGGKGTARCAGPEATSVRADPAFIGGFVAYLVRKHGPAAGRRIYVLDNEPSLWSTTHRDVRPGRLGYDELWQRTRDYATAILEADPSAEIAGPAEWGWPGYFCSDADDQSKGCSPSSPDRARHGGEELVAWLLDRAREHETKTGRRILHYLDLHYYPQADRPPEDVRSLWDPSYKDPSWVNDTVRLVPRMRDWVAKHYPGTKTAIGEYDFHHHGEAIGAVTYAEVLGVFGREGLDLATAWAPPAAGEAAFAAYRLYRNFDGKGGAFESTSVRATASGAGVAAFAAAGPRRLTVALACEGAAQTVRVALAGFEASGAAALWVAEKGGAMARLADVPIAGGALAFELPATSIAMLVVEGRGPEEQANRAADAGAAPSTPVDAGAPVAGSAPAAPPGPRRACGFAPEPPGPSPWGAIALGAALASAARRRGRAPVVDARHAGLG